MTDCVCVWLWVVDGRSGRFGKVLLRHLTTVSDRWKTCLLLMRTGISCRGPRWWKELASRLSVLGVTPIGMTLRLRFPRPSVTWMWHEVSDC